MQLPIKIAFKYIFSKKSQALINVISSIAIIGIIVGTAALVVLLSTFNGLKEWIIITNKNIDPSFKITLEKGKNFTFNASEIKKIKQLDGVSFVIPTYEDNALVTYQERQSIVLLKGVDSNYINAIDFDTLLVAGETYLKSDALNFALIGIGVVDKLQATLLDAFNPITIYAPKKEANISVDPQNAFLQQNVYMSGVLSVHEEFDEKTVVVPLDVAQQIFQAENLYTSLEIFCVEGTNLNSTKEKINSLLGARYKLLDQYEQHEFMYKIVLIEKIAVYIILSFILIIVMFNLLGIIAILIIDKANDIRVLNCIGMPTSNIKKIFFWQGFIMNGIGGFIGIILGIVIAVLQEKFSIIKINEYGDAYPVSIELNDLLLILLTTFIIGSIAALFGVLKTSVNKTNS